MKYLKLLILLLVTACGSLITNDKQRIFIDIYPNSKDAHFFVNGVERNLDNEGVPISKNSKGVILKVQKDGYVESSIYLKSNINMMVGAFDAFLTLGIGFIPDHNSGRLYYFDTNNVRFNLTKMEEK